jgi:hypothetical protein
MSALPASLQSGPISMSQVRQEFGSNFRALSSLRGVANGVPTTGRITLCNMYGKGATDPVVSAAVPTQLRDSSAGVTNDLLLSSVAAVSDSFGSPLAYSVVSTPPNTSAVVTNAGNGSVRFTAGVGASSTSNAVVRVTNRFSRTANIIVPLDYGPRPSIEHAASVMAGLSNTPATHDLAPLFNNSAPGSVMSYQLTANPLGNASIASSVLSVTPNYRASTYNVQVSGSTKYGSAGSTTVTVAELPTPGTSSLYAPGQTYPPIGLTATPQLISGQQYGNGIYAVSSGGGNALGAFDSNAATNWASPGGSTFQGQRNWSGSSHTRVVGTGSGTSNSTFRGPWLMIQLPYAVRIVSTSLTPATWETEPTVSFVLGSTNGYTWSNVATASNAGAGLNTSRKTFSVAHAGFYTHYLLTWTSIFASGTYLARLAEWSLTT